MSSDRAPRCFARISPVWFSALVHRQYQATVDQFLVNVHGGRGQHDLNRAFDVGGLSGQVACGIPSDRCVPQLTFALQEFQRVGRFGDAFVFADG